MNNGANGMPTRKIIALALLAVIFSALGILVISGSINLSAAFFLGIVIGMLLSLGLAAVFGIPKFGRSSTPGSKPPPTQAR
ncbi:MAG: hypothetical protein B7Y43_04405 [Sphingomonas sp. 28-62-20]|nr:hypothetical protein [Sphingomonas sp.]OYY78798.1 MAG: hypothetical protein B7Y43_04405 [Sphingomonas sp. 28-62-20]